MIANILDGIVLGLQFGLLAAGLTLVYGLGGVLNLAYGQMAVISAMVVVFALEADIPVLPAAGWQRLSVARRSILSRRSNAKMEAPPSRTGDGLA